MFDLNKDQKQLLELVIEQESVLILAKHLDMLF